MGQYWISPGPVTTDRSPQTGHQRLATTDRSPQTGHTDRSPETGHHRPVTTDRPPQTGHQRLATTDRPPQTGHHRPITTDRSPQTGHHRLVTSYEQPLALQEVSVPPAADGTWTRQIISSSFGLTSTSLIFKMRNQRGSLIPLNNSLPTNTKHRPHALEVAKIFQHVHPRPRTIPAALINESIKARLQAIDKRIQRLEELLPQLQLQRSETLSQVNVRAPPPSPRLHPPSPPRPTRRPPPSPPFARPSPLHPRHPPPSPAIPPPPSRPSPPPPPSALTRPRHPSPPPPASTHRSLLPPLSGARVSRTEVGIPAAANAVHPRPRTIPAALINESIKARLQAIDKRIQRLEELLPQLQLQRSETLSQVNVRAPPPSPAVTRRHPPSPAVPRRRPPSPAIPRHPPPSPAIARHPPHHHPPSPAIARRHPPSPHSLHSSEPFTSSFRSSSVSDRSWDSCSSECRCLLTVKVAESHRWKGALARAPLW
ncbi:hypothetical protein D4764_05G0000230 [Takifugu flavidus]|uniref:Uncharacterized protein n=1 Tax=Takifugu flavidus TaxID=433684 RepID=A0A5C6MY91_9TELE|nr:hypothetical protein D4764_05G0000230 [Takifugu flavidus]